MVKVTMEQVINFRNGADFFGGMNLPLKVAYKLNKIKKAIEKESEFYSEKFQEIIENYAKKDDDGNLIFSEGNDQIMIQEDKIEECNEAIINLQTLEVEIDNCNLTIEDFGEDLQCTPDELDILMPFMD